MTELPDLVEDVPEAIADAPVTVRLVYHALARNDGVLERAQLERRLGVSRNTATRTVDRLERHGLVERRDDPADPRRTWVVLVEDVSSE